MGSTWGHISCGTQMSTATRSDSRRNCETPKALDVCDFPEGFWLRRSNEHLLFSFISPDFALISRQRQYIEDKGHFHPKGEIICHEWNSRTHRGRWLRVDRHCIAERNGEIGDDRLNWIVHVDQHPGMRYHIVKLKETSHLFDHPQKLHIRDCTVWSVGVHLNVRM